MVNSKDVISVEGTKWTEEVPDKAKQRTITTSFSSALQAAVVLSTSSTNIT
jgi:hypothetical protein